MRAPLPPGDLCRGRALGYAIGPHPLPLCLRMEAFNRREGDEFQIWLSLVNAGLKATPQDQAGLERLQRASGTSREAASLLGCNYRFGRRFSSSRSSLPVPTPPHIVSQGGP